MKLNQSMTLPYFKFATQLGIEKNNFNSDRSKQIFFMNQ